LLSPPHAANTIRERNDSAAALVRRRVHASNISRSSSESSICTAVGLGITKSYYCTETNDSPH